MEMGLILRAIILCVILLALSRYFISRTVKSPPRLPDTWWTPGSEKTADNAIRRYNVTFSKELVEDLKYRLKHTRDLTPSLKDAGWTYGTNTEILRKFLDYWRNSYDFEQRERFINQYPHFITNVQGLDIHFIHIKPNKLEGKRVLPLLILHGWPGSIMEFYKIIPLLTTPRADQDFVFEIIAPSLPGFGFSSPATITGLSAPHIAVVFKNLMQRLGFDKFYVQGGDWGAIITNDISSLFPQHVLGMHSNMCTAWGTCNTVKELLYYYLPFLAPTDYQPLRSPKEEAMFILRESGYFHIQATKPDTVGVGLKDSPAGLASYIIEKFASSVQYDKTSTNDATLGKFTYDELIDNLMFYWVPNSITTAMRLYAENVSKSFMKLDMFSMPVTVPSACVQFPYEIKTYPANILRSRYLNLVRVTKMPVGGHFAALEEPVLMANDIWASIGEMETLKKNKNKDKSDL